MGNKVGKEQEDGENIEAPKEYEISFLQGRMSAMEIKEKVEEEEDNPVQTNIKEGGLSYFVELEKKPLPPPPPRLLKRPRISNRTINNMYDSDEKQLMADILHQDNLNRRGISAALREERHVLARLRREEKDRMKKEQHEAKMRAREECRRRRDEFIKQRRNASGHLNGRSKFVSSSYTYVQKKALVQT